MFIDERSYSARFSNVTGTAGTPYEIFTIAVPDDRVVALDGIVFNQSSDFGDAEDEMIEYEITRGYTGFGGGPPISFVPLNSNDPNTSVTCNYMGTILASGGSPVTLVRDTFNIRLGLRLFFPPRLRPIFFQGATVYNVIRLSSGTLDDVIWDGVVFISEI